STPPRNSRSRRHENASSSSSRPPPGSPLRGGRREPARRGEWPVTSSLKLRATAKSAVRRLLRAAGYEICRTSSDFFELQRRLLPGCDLIVDVGANTGQYVELVRSLGYPGRVVSFEPQSAALDVLRARAKRTDWWDVR